MSRIVDFTHIDGKNVISLAAVYILAMEPRADKVGTVVYMPSGNDSVLEIVSIAEHYDEAVRRWKEALEEK